MKCKKYISLQPTYLKVLKSRANLKKSFYIIKVESEIEFENIFKIFVNVIGFVMFNLLSFESSNMKPIFEQ